jgi:hypothetical protein
MGRKTKRNKEKRNEEKAKRNGKRNKWLEREFYL